ncbi:MAG TPA: SRPBCC domain-containing protein [Xanthobacteraceae bacterium]
MDDPIEKEIFIDAAPEEVFAYLTESRKYLLWMGVDAELDPRPGGRFKVDPNGRDVIFGEFLEVVPPRRVVFTWGFDEPDHPMPAGSSRVEIDLVAQDGGTLLRLQHFGVTGSRREQHAGGWQHYLSRLTIVVAGGDPGPDPYGTPATRHS